MIYELGNKEFQYTYFAIDIDELFFSHFPSNWLVQRGAEAWLAHNRNRIYLRAYVFCDSVLERHNNGQMGFKDPVLVWANLNTQTFSVHPGQNRIILKMLLPEVRQVGWVIDNQSSTSRKDYEGIFNNIQPLVRGKNNERLDLFQMQHRSGFGGEDQYHLSLTTDTYLGNKILDTPKRRQKWAELCETKGFGIYTGNKYWYDIGKAEANYNVLNIAGIYQCFLHHFHNFPYSYWKELHFKEI